VITNAAFVVMSDAFAGSKPPLKGRVKRMRLPVLVPRRLRSALGRVIWPLEVTVAERSAAGVGLRGVVALLFEPICLTSVPEVALFLRWGNLLLTLTLVERAHHGGDS